MSAKSDHGLPARSTATKRLVSKEEVDFRWDFARGLHGLKDYRDFNKKIAEIRKRTGKP